MALLFVSYVTNFYRVDPTGCDRSCFLNRKPEIGLNYLRAERDRRIVVKSLCQARKIMTARALAEYQPTEILPGPEYMSDEELIEKFGDIGTTIFHATGTCKMAHDPMSVVGDNLKVHGVGNLRVVDASIMPKIVSVNTAFPVIMIAEKAAQMVCHVNSCCPHKKLA